MAKGYSAVFCFSSRIGGQNRIPRERMTNDPAADGLIMSVPRERIPLSPAATDLFFCVPRRRMTLSPAAPV